MSHGIVPLWEVFFSFITPSFVFSSCYSSSPDLSITIAVIVIIHLVFMTCAISPKLICSCLYLSIFPSDSPSNPSSLSGDLSSALSFCPESASQLLSNIWPQFVSLLLRSLWTRACGGEWGGAVIYWVCVCSPGLASLLIVASVVQSVA